MAIKKIFTSLIVILNFIPTGARGEHTPRFRLFEPKVCTYKKDYSFEKSGIIRKLKVKCPNEMHSYAYILNGKIRTHFQTLLIWPYKTKIRGIEIIEFNEPGQYKAPMAWYQSINGSGPDGLYTTDALSGATLTRESTLKLAKQALSLDKR